MKKAILYHRISKEKQSNFSIEYQEKFTRAWADRNNVEVLASFTDDGYSARTFDRPDFTKLQLFIKQYYKQVDYLIVNTLDRFSRDAGEALTKVKMLQRVYNVFIVSASEGIILDPNNTNSFFLGGLRLLQAEDFINELKKRTTAGRIMALQNGRHLGTAPFGYINARDKSNKTLLLIDSEKALIIKYIFDQWVSGMPLYKIAQEVKLKGYTGTGHSRIKELLSNPVYTGLVRVPANDNKPVELVEGLHERIIDRSTYYRAQELFIKGNPKKIIDDNYPLRGVLRCYCGSKVTGADSRGKSGKYYPYYKCNQKRHLNASATKLHLQFDQVLQYMSLPDYAIDFQLQDYKERFDQMYKNSRVELQKKKRELSEAETDRDKLEKLYIKELIQPDTYTRQHEELQYKILTVNAEINRLSQDYNSLMVMYTEQIPKLGNLPELYNSGTVTQKQELVNMVFDSRLYYRDSTYRTPFMMTLFAHNTSILAEKRLLIIDGQNSHTGNSNNVPEAGVQSNKIFDLLQFIQKIKAA